MAESEKVHNKGILGATEERVGPPLVAANLPRVEVPSVLSAKEIGKALLAWTYGLSRAEANLMDAIADEIVLQRSHLNGSQEAKDWLNTMLEKLSSEKIIPFARMWTHETEKWKPIDEGEYNSIRANSLNGQNCPRIFIFDNGEYALWRVGEIYFDGQSAFPSRGRRENKKPITALQYRLLVHLLKNRNHGQGVPLEELVESCFGFGIDDAQELRRRRTTPHYDPARHRDYATQYRNEIGDLSKRLQSWLKVSVQTEGTSRYHLVPWVTYCLIQRSQPG